MSFIEKTTRYIALVLGMLAILVMLMALLVEFKRGVTACQNEKGPEAFFQFRGGQDGKH